MPTVSVVMPTARYGGLDILEHSMRHQTFRDFEVLIVDELHRRDIIESLGWIYVEPPPKKPGMWWNLDASLNAAIRRARGDVIVQMNDYVWAPPTGIAQFLIRLAQEPKGMISGVSDQYMAPPQTNPKGLFSVWDSTVPLSFPPSGEKVFSDPRKADHNKGFYVTIPLLFEGNWCAYARQAWLDVGGYDEAFDIGWGYDNVEFPQRAQFAGYHTFLDTNNEVYCWSHIRLFDEQQRRDSAPNNHELYNRLSRAWYKGLAPWKLNYT